MDFYTSPTTGQTYSYRVEEHERTCYAQMGNPDSQYLTTYSTAVVYKDNKMITFVNVYDNNVNDAVKNAVEWHESRAVKENLISSRYD